MAPLLTLESLFKLSCPVELMTPEDTELPFVVEGTEQFPSSGFLVEFRNESQVLASCSIDAQSISVSEAVLSEIFALQSPTLHMRLVPYSGGYPLAKTPISIHPFYNIRLLPVENGVEIQIPAGYSGQSDDASLRVTSTLFTYEPQNNVIVRQTEEEFDYANPQNNTFNFGSPPPEHNIAVLIRVVDGHHQREEYFPIRTEPCVLGEIRLSNTQLLRGEVPDVPKVEFIHHPNSPPEAIQGVYEFNPTNGDEGLKTRPVVFNRGKWSVVCSCQNGNGTCNRFGVKVVFSSVRTDEDYNFLVQQGFFDDLDAEVRLTEPFTDSQPLVATPDGLACILQPTLQRNIESLAKHFFDRGPNHMLRFSAGRKISIQVANENYEKPSRLATFSQEQEMFEFKFDENGNFNHILFSKGMPCETHEPEFFFIVNGQHQYSNKGQVMWEPIWEKAIVTFPKITQPISEIDVRIRLPKPGYSASPNLSLGWWRHE